MAIKFTDEQQKVIDTRNSNVLVSAAAGSGKTAVLVERIVNMVCNEEKPVDIDKLLVVTFTNAAAAEMRERIAKGIAERVEAEPDNEHIQRQATLIHNAQITTIDSFCLFLLRNHFHEIGLDPAFRIADAGEIKLLQQDVMAELFEDAYASGDEAFRYCVEYFCPGGRETALEEDILKLAAYADSFPKPEKWLEERKKDYDPVEGVPFEQSESGAYLLAYLKQMTQGWLEKMQKLKSLCEEPDGPHMYGKCVDEDLERMERLAECDSLEKFAATMGNFAWGKLSSASDPSVSVEKRELAKKRRDELKKSVGKAAEDFFKTPLELAARQAAQCAKPVETLIDLTLEFNRRMAEKLREKKILTFAEAEHFALDILLQEDGVTPSDVAREYKKHFAEVLIDEYQDSNLVQESLLRAISGESEGNYNYFMVGDVKQSIYRFRLARPQLFLDKYHSYEEDGEKIRIDLAKNFRSRAEVLDAVNGVFSHIMRREVGDIDYDDSAALHLGAEYPENTGDEAELLLVEKPAKDSDESVKEAEASAVARKIKDLMGSLQVTDKESKVLRPVKYSDIVILLRTTTGWDEVFRKVLENQGIPAYASSKSGYFNALEVQELLQFLKVLDNATQDIPLFGVMKSVFGGFREEEIAKIRIRNRKMSLYEALKCYAADPEEEKLGQKAAAFLEMIGKYRKMTVYLPVRDLLTKIVNDFEYLNYVTALPAGSKRKANVEMLFTRASDFEKTSYFGLFHFLRYMDQLQKYEVDFGEGELLDENADVVRIMSIHKSKGLEFPVTFVAGMSKQFNMEDTTGPLLLDVDMGLGVDYVDPVGRTTNKTLRKKVLSLKLKKDTLSEELRILYVALTRAKEKLIMTGVLKDAESALAEAYEDPDDQLSFADFMSALSYLDFVLPIVGNTGIQSSVFAEEEKAAGDVGEQVDLMLRKNRLLHSGELCDENALEKLRDRLNREYAFANLAGLYTKTTVSELKIAAMADKDEAAFHDFEEKEVQPYIPSFRREEEEVTGTVRGNAYHRVMELLDFDAEEELTEESLAAFLDEETASRRLPKEYREVVNLKKILRFRRSELGQRMHLASLQGKLFREQPFVLGIAADRVNPEFPESEKVLIQGIIDVFWEEEDGLVLLDYKTDSVNSLKELWNRYETQLDYYSEALERIYGKPVKERYLYSFRLESF